MIFRPMSLLCDLFVCAHTFRWVSQKTEITRSQLIVLSTVFFFFQLFENMADKLGKVRRLHWKSVKLPSLKAIVENEWSIAPQSLACVQTSPISFVATKEIGDVCTQATQSPVGRLYYGGGSNLPPPPQHTNVCKFTQLRKVISSLA